MHDGLRDELARLRTAAASGEPAGPAARSLPAHCVAFCAALTRHHTAEDARAFPALAAEFPDLVPVLDKLGEDHRMISGIIQRVEALSSAAASGEDGPRLLGELDGLMAILESHFGFEERRIAQALNALELSAAEALGLDPPSGRLFQPNG